MDNNVYGWEILISDYSHWKANEFANAYSWLMHCEHKQLHKDQLV